MDDRNPYWFHLDGCVIPDYGRAIGADGLAVYVCMAYACRSAREGTFDTQDIAHVLAMSAAALEEAIERLVAARVILRETWGQGEETHTRYTLRDLNAVKLGATPVDPLQEAQPRKEKKPKTVSGHLYVIEGGGYYKIGRSKYLIPRLHGLDVKAPFPFKIHAVIPTDDIHAGERELHQRFAAKHHRGEWFNLTEDDIQEIRRRYPTINHDNLSVY